jgi:hypothetical protein
MAGPRTNFRASVNFLKRFHPGRPWVLTAIPPDHKRIETATFEEETEKQLLDWLREHTGDNIYFSVAEPVKPLDKKAERTDIKAVHWLHVDLDPRAGEDLEEERKRILKTLQEFSPKPTVIVFSGGGYQGFWRLTDPIDIDGNLDKAEDAKRYNMQLELLLGGDQCHNVDRIMRLPGTINRPNKRKREKGRVEELAKMIKGSGKSYDLKEFLPAPVVQNESQQFNSETVHVSENVKRLDDVNDLPKEVPDLCKVVIVQGHDPDNPGKWPSRSECLFWVCCELVRAGCDDDLIYSVITDPGFNISESILEKKSGATKYALRQIERARENAVDPMLQQLNDRYAVIGNWGGKCRILTERADVIGDVKRTRVSFLSFQDFKNFWCNKAIQVGTDEKTNLPILIPVGKWWINHPARREFETVVFAPGHEIKGAYNLWKGFAYNASPGDCSLFLEHVRKNVCSGDEEVYDYLLGWMANAVQHPYLPGHTAVVLRGRQGTGKGRFAHNFGALFGRHFLPIRDSNHLFGQFNAHLRDCIVLFADEAFWAGNAKHEGLLKSLITEETVMCEAKGVDTEPAQNYIHLIMASNEDWVVPARGDDRRFLVLDMGEENRRDGKFFQAMQEQLRNGGYEALLHMLMTYDLSEFNVENIPQTQALREQKMRTLGPEEEWWYAKLQAGRVFEKDKAWPSRVFSSQLQYDFITYCRSWGAGTRSNSSKLGRFLVRVFPADWIHRAQLRGTYNVIGIDGIGTDIVRPYVNLIPPLDDCRDIWAELYGGPYEWPEIEEIEEIEKDTNKDKDGLYNET